MTDIGLAALDILISLFYLIKEVLRFLPVEAYLLIAVLVIFGIVNRVTP